MHNLKSPLFIGALMATSILGGCSTSTKNPDLPIGAAAYQVVPADVATPKFYTVRSQDVVTLRVLGEPDVSADELRVDEAGFLQVPLIGPVQAAGRSVNDISADVTRRLAAQYLVDPQVSVSVKEMALRYVSVEGEVKKPGVYEIDSKATLLSALARAESPLVTAKLDEVVVFRTVNGQRMAARFDIKAIRTGISPDPAIIDGDVVMVGYSSIKGFWQDVLKSAGLLNTFVILSR